MGFEDSNQKRIYCNIKEGNIIHHRKDGTIEEHIGLSGTIYDILFKDDSKFGRELHIILQDKDETLYQLQMLFNSRYARAFLKIVKNVSMLEPVKIVPTYKTVNDKPKTGMIVFQNGTALKWYYTLDNPNGLPPMEPCKLRDNKTGMLVDGWDNSAQMEFLRNMLVNEVRPQITPKKSI